MLNQYFCSLKTMKYSYNYFNLDQFMDFTSHPIFLFGSTCKASLQSIRSRYNPSDIEKLARLLVAGQLPRLKQTSHGDKIDYFPAMLAYEHKYNYKLKFLTDFNIGVLNELSITNLVVSFFIVIAFST